MSATIITRYTGGAAGTSPQTMYLTNLPPGAVRVTHRCVLSAADYAALPTKQGNTLYCINESAASPKTRTAHRWDALAENATAYYLGDTAVTPVQGGAPPAGAPYAWTLLAQGSDTSEQGVTRSQTNLSWKFNVIDSTGENRSAWLLAAPVGGTMTLTFPGAETIVMTVTGTFDGGTTMNVLHEAIGGYDPALEGQLATVSFTP